MILKEGVPDQVLLSINVPQPWTGEVRFTRQSKKNTRNQLSEGKDPRGRSYFWLSEQKIDRDVEPDTDYAAIFAGAVSVTPLHLDPTHTESLNHFRIGERRWRRRFGAEDAAVSSRRPATVRLPKGTAFPVRIEPHHDRLMNGGSDVSWRQTEKRRRAAALQAVSVWVPGLRRLAGRCFLHGFV